MNQAKKDKSLRITIYKTDYPNKSNIGIKKYAKPNRA